MPDQRDSLSLSQWDAAKDLFDRALDLPEVERLAFVEGATEDPAVAAQASRWLENWGPAQGFFERVSTDLALLITAPSYLPGDQLQDRFVVRRFIARGGMGEVYEAEDRKVGQTVALKVIGHEWVRSHRAREKFIGEVGLARQVTHPNVCRIHELFEEGDRLFFSMELLDGVTLTKFLRDAKPGRDDARLIAWQIAEGLQAAHALGIVHGDLKPGNVMVVHAPGKPLRAVVTDFGLARAAETAPHSPGGGTPGFIAPEVQAGGSTTVQSDYYSYGKLIEQLLPGNRWAARLNAANPEDRPKSLSGIAGDLSERR